MIFLVATRNNKTSQTYGVCFLLQNREKRVRLALLMSVRIQYSTSRNPTTTLRIHTVIRWGHMKKEACLNWEKMRSCRTLGQLLWLETFLISTQSRSFLKKSISTCLILTIFSIYLVTVKISAMLGTDS